MIADSFIQQLLGRTDIVDTVERYIKLKKTGANYSACCPFHSEKTPSFTVSPAKQFYYCFGCGASGSAIGFVMQYAGLSFVDAVTELAERVGLVVPQISERTRQVQAQKKPLTELLSAAANFYRGRLKRSTKAIDYLKSRGLTGAIAQRFGLGYAPDEWQGLQTVFPDYNEAQLVECGLVIVNEQGRRYDRFRDRIMFPILDARGNVIAFGGRFIGDAQQGHGGGPKYLNSPETPLFEKGRELYGLPQARQTIRDSDQIIVVEGYMDVVALAQYGIGNVVATLGTACTAEHVSKLLRQAEKVVFCFDGDAAGRRAAWRALEVSLALLTDGKSVSFLFLPPDHDPDSFVRAHGAHALRALADHPTGLAEFLLREIKAGVDLTAAEGRAQLIFKARPHVQKLAAVGLRAQIIRALAHDAALSPAEVDAQIGNSFPQRRSANYQRLGQRQSPRSLEYQLLRTVLPQPQRSACIPLDVVPQESAEGALLHAIANAIDHGELPVAGSGVLLEYFRGTAHEALLNEMAGQLANSEEDSLEAEFAALIEKLMQRCNHSETVSLTQTMGSYGDQDSREQLRRLLAEKQKRDQANIMRGSQ